jgi:hypothetical protein
VLPKLIDDVLTRGPSNLLLFASDWHAAVAFTHFSTGDSQVVGSIFAVRAAIGCVCRFAAQPLDCVCR